MQFLMIDNKTKLSDLNNNLGSQVVESILHTNQLPRVPDIGKEFETMCESIVQSTPSVDWQRKISILNRYTENSDVFEFAALLDEDGWKILSSINTLPGYLQIPPSILIPDSGQVLGSNEHIPSVIYNKVMQSLKVEHYVNPAAFAEYSSIKPNKLNAASVSKSTIPVEFKLPWGQVSLYSSLSDAMIDFPVYPEEMSDGVKANYTQMPELLYQYEPWQIYTSSGPRTNTYKFKFHRDMWGSNHTQGGATTLVRFCEANCYPEYNGSSVNTSTVTLYVRGTALISGVLTDVTVNWSGPLGHDGFYLMCELSLTITEVATKPLSYSEILKKSIIG